MSKLPVDPKQQPEQDPAQDPELRQLLDGIGLYDDRTVVPRQTDQQAAAARELLARVVATEKRPDTPRSDGAPATEARKAARQERRRTRLTWPSGWPNPVLARPLVLAAGVAVIALVVGMAVVRLPGPPAAAETPPLLHFSRLPEGSASFEGAPAKGELMRLARLVLDSPQPNQRNQAAVVQHTQTYGWWASTNLDAKSTALIPQRIDNYAFPDNTLRSLARRGPAMSQDGRVTNKQGAWTTGPTNTDDTMPDDRGHDYPEKLPTKIPKLAETLAPRSVYKDLTGGAAIISIQELFTWYVVPPEVTANLWRALAAQPDVTALGTTTDRWGRPAHAYSAPGPSPHRRTIILISPTGEYLGTETLMTSPEPGTSFTPPAVVEFTSLLSSEWIPSTDVPSTETTRTLPPDPPLEIHTPQAPAGRRALQNSRGGVSIRSVPDIH